MRHDTAERSGRLINQETMEQTKTLSGYLRENWNLLSYRVWADLRNESRQLYIGSFWWILEPLAHMSVLYLVFGVILQRGGPA